MRRIAASFDPQLTAPMSHKQAEKEDSGTRLNQPHNSAIPDDKQLKGVSRLVNPQGDPADIAVGEEDPVERDYLGRLLHVADEALQYVKRGGDHRRRRGRPH